MTYRYACTSYLSACNVNPPSLRSQLPASALAFFFRIIIFIIIRSISISKTAPIGCSLRYRTQRHFFPVLISRLHRQKFSEFSSNLNLLFSFPSLRDETLFHETLDGSSAVVERVLYRTAFEVKFDNFN